MMCLRKPHSIRRDFSAAMSEMYRAEVPAYGQLLDIVSEVNESLVQNGDVEDLNLIAGEDTRRLSQERHGAIRLGTAAELNMMARIFAVMGMYPVGYYDLSVAAIPVHSTAFRPVERRDIAHNPFRLFTSLLRLELIEDDVLRQTAKDALARRQIFSDRAVLLTEKAEGAGGLSADDASDFVSEVLETFRWHSEACVDVETFDALNASHRLIADIVSFKGPHINHLTPRILDIDRGQRAMGAKKLPAKAVIEGPPRRKCPILLRQTAFKALEEPISFLSKGGVSAQGYHTARFGEIEQRGVALTHKGRALYDKLLAQARSRVLPDAKGGNAQAYEQALSEAFKAFPDDWRQLYDQSLAYFKFSINETVKNVQTFDVSILLDAAILKLSPIIYEDFLPVSAAGIFQSNLGDDANEKLHPASNKALFEEALGRKVIDEFELYKAIQTESLVDCLAALKTKR